jgi:hypothetical protein
LRCHHDRTARCHHATPRTTARTRARRGAHLVRLGDERKRRLEGVVEERGDLDAAARRDELEDAVRRDQQDTVVGRERVRLDLGLRIRGRQGRITRAAPSRQQR